MRASAGDGASAASGVQRATLAAALVWAERVLLTVAMTSLEFQSSIRFEVRKLFRLEVPAFGRQFDAGTCTIDYPFLFGKTVKYRCESRAEYVTLWTASYLERFSEFFASRFPDHAHRIVELFASATNEFGASDFGENAAATIMPAAASCPAR